jgi:hypothetical protein
MVTHKSEQISQDGTTVTVEAPEPAEHTLRVSLRDVRGESQVFVTFDDDLEIQTAAFDTYAGAREHMNTWRSPKANEAASTRLSVSLQRMLFGAQGTLSERLREDMPSPGGLRLIIEADDPSLQELPWELAANPGLAGPGQPDPPRLLIEVAGLSVVRTSTKRAGMSMPPIEGALGVALTFGQGNDGVDTDPYTLISSLRMIDGLSLEISSDGCSFEEAMRTIKESTHVFEFLGHGALSETASLLQFEDGSYSIKQMGNQLTKHPNLRAVVLAACNTGTARPGTGAWDKLSVPIVVLMQREISLTEAKNFSAAFLSSLSQVGSIDGAMAAGRRAITTQADKATPIVYVNKGSSAWVARREPLNRTKPVGSTFDRTVSSTPILRATPKAGAEEMPLQTFLDTRLSREVSAGGQLRAITPYFGPGALRVGVGLDAGSLEEIWWDPALPSFEPSREQDSALNEDDLELARFLRQLVVERRGERRVVPRPAEHTPPAPASAVRLRLARLAQAANELVLSSLSLGTTPVSGLERSQVAIPPESPFLVLLAETIDACPSARRADDLLLRSDRIRRRLNAVRKELTLTRQLRWGTAVWLTDLLWHVLICDSPVYPYIEELAMQVSILQGESTRPTRRLEPSSAMSPGTDDLGALREACALAVRRGFNVDEPQTSVRRELYSASSELLRRQYRDWHDNGLIPNFWGQPKAAAIALTTTFDLELERGLAAGGEPFHVAVPVYVTSDPDTPGGTDQLRWLVGTFACQSDNPTVDELATPVNGIWHTLGSLATSNLQGANLLGPLVIKLNGSPLHQIPGTAAEVQAASFVVNGSPNSSSRRGLAPQGSAAAAFAKHPTDRREGHATRTDMEHAIALGEFDFLQAMRTSLWSIDSSRNGPREVGLPVWLCVELWKRHRYWVLIGHRLADWSSRTQIFTLLMNDDQLLNGALSRGFVVAKKFDQDRLRFHEWLGLQRTTGDAGNLTTAFRQLLDDQEVPS